MNLTLGGLSITIKSGAIIPVLLMLPNVVWMLSPKADASAQASAPTFLTMLENVGRIYVLILPFFYALDLNKQYSTPVAIGMTLALIIYYAAWIRYFLGRTSAELFRAPLLGIPLPLAIAPTAFLVLASYLMSSWHMLGASVLFGFAHIWVSNLTL